MKKIITNKVFIVIVIFLVGLAIGRFSLPAKVITKTETKIVEKIVEATHKDIKTDTVVVITETTDKEGVKTKKTVITDKTKTEVDIDKKTNTNTTAKTEKIVQYDKNSLVISALVGTDTFSSGGSSNPIFGGHVQKRLIGPIYMGIWGLSNKTFGASIALTF